MSRPNTQQPSSQIPHPLHSALHALHSTPHAPSPKILNFEPSILNLQPLNCTSSAPSLNPAQGGLESIDDYSQIKSVQVTFGKPWNPYE